MDGTEQQRGATLVEFALVALLLFALLFGVIEFGLHFSDQQSVRQGAREGARAAVVNNFPSSCTGTITVKTACVTRKEVGLGTADTFIKIIPTAPTTSSVNDHGTTTICVKYRADSVTGFFPFLDNLYLTTRVQMRNEVEAAESIVAYEETLPSGGGDWSFCSAT